MNSGSLVPLRLSMEPGVQILLFRLFCVKTRYLVVYIEAFEARNPSMLRGYISLP